MPAKVKKNQVNLIPKSDFESSALGQVLTWLLTTFRYIVITTEMVVMLAFFSRIWLDARNADLADEIKQKEAILNASASFEETFRANQEKLAFLKGAYASEGKILVQLQDIVTKTPGDITLSTYVSDETGLTLKGASPSEQSIAQYVVNLSTSENFSAVNLNEVKVNEENGLLDFTLNLIAAEAK